MRPTPLAAIAVALLAAGALAGCISGSFHEAVVSGSLPSGWQYDAQNSQGGEQGNVIVKVQYKLNVYDNNGGTPGALAVVSVSSVPVIDLQSEIKKKIDDWVGQQGIELSQTGTGQTTIQGNKVDYTLFDATKSSNGSTIHGRAIDAKYTCAANSEAVRLFGFAATQSATSSLLGGPPQSDTSTWLSIVGSDPPANPAAGMLGQVACS